MSDAGVRSLFDLLPDAALELDADRRIVSANPAAVRLTGYPLAALVGADCGQLLGVRSRDGYPLWVNDWGRGARLPGVRGIPEQLIILRRADGRDGRALVTGTYLRDDRGGLHGAVVSLRDPARREDQGVEIVSTVSHELRAPLASVKGYTSLLLNRWHRLDDDQKRMMLEQVNHDADRVTRLITELLDISRLESGQLVLHRQWLNLTDVVPAVVEKVRLEYPQLQAELDLPANFPPVWADADKVEQVLTNLLENACKYASPRGLRVEGSANDEEVAISVTDCGEGIPPEDLPRVFEKFFRRPEGRPTGSGLGLWISRGLVEAHGGRLSATSVPGKGSAFRFTLPRADGKWATRA
jgi:PAS domain S-box-containing protein